MKRSARRPYSARHSSESTGMRLPLAFQRLLERAHRPLEVAARQADELARLALDLQAGVALERLDEAAEQALRQRIADHDRLVDVAGRERGYETRAARRLVLRTRRP